jgi:hypothetical protein
MSRRKKKAEFEVFSLAFLDCICCGFGAMILIFVLTASKVDRASSASRAELDADLKQKLAALHAAQNLHASLLAEVASSDIETADLQKELGDLERQLEILKAQLQNEDGGAKALVVDVDDLKKEIAALQKKVPDVPQLNATTPIGVPVTSNYVAFVIDTSGSMRDPNTEQLWNFVMKKFEEVIRAYPIVKGVQFLDADGRFILGRGDGWIPDSSEARQAIIDAVRRYQIFSNSNPVPGITRAIRALHDEKNADMKMGIYVFGDEFTETSDQVLERVDRLNPPDSTGKRPVVINGLGFPTGAWTVAFGLGQTGLKFANLMRELAWRHGGAFIACTTDQ